MIKVSAAPAVLWLALYFLYVCVPMHYHYSSMPNCSLELARFVLHGATLWLLFCIFVLEAVGCIKAGLYKIRNRQCFVVCMLMNKDSLWVFQSSVIQL